MWGGLQKVSRGPPPRSSSRTRPPTAFLTFSVHCAFDIAIVRWLGVLLPPLPPRLGARDKGPAGARHYRRVTSGVYSEVGRGCDLWSMLACSARGVRAVAGLTGPHTFCAPRGMAVWGGGGSVVPHAGRCHRRLFVVCVGGGGGRNKDRRSMPVRGGGYRGGSGVLPRMGLGHEAPDTLPPHTPEAQVYDHSTSDSTECRPEFTAAAVIEWVAFVSPTLPSPFWEYSVATRPARLGAKYQAASRSESTPHRHVLVCICRNVEAVRSDPTCVHGTTLSLFYVGLQYVNTVLGGGVGLGEGLTWSPTHGPRRLPCRTRLGGCTRVSGHGSRVRGGGGGVLRLWTGLMSVGERAPPGEPCQGSDLLEERGEQPPVVLDQHALQQREDEAREDGGHEGLLALLRRGRGTVQQPRHEGVDAVQRGIGVLTGLEELLDIVAFLGEVLQAQVLEVEVPFCVCRWHAAPPAYVRADLYDVTGTDMGRQSKGRPLRGTGRGNTKTSACNPRRAPCTMGGAGHTRGHKGGVFAQRGHSANYYGDYPGNNPANHPPAESCTINSNLKNSIAFGSAPRREVDSQPISP